MKKPQALGEIVIVEVVNNKEKKTDSGLYIPQSHDKESMSQAKVVSVGPKVEGFTIGDTVIVSRLVGELFELDGIQYRAMRQEDIFGVVVEGE